MKAQVIRPTNKVLKRYIKYFLFMESEDFSYNNLHTSFPNTNVCLGLFKGNRLIETSDHHYTVSESKNFSSYLTGIYHKPTTFRYNGKFSEVCIDFEPLGLDVISGHKLSKHLFLNEVIETIMSKHWGDLYKFAFTENTYAIRAQLMETFFLKAFYAHDKPIEFYPFNKIYSSSVTDLQASFNKSYRSIHRIYKDNLGMGPKDFLMMKRFRMSLQGLHDFQLNKLAVLDYSLEFSDQSHFIRNFKKYSGFTPKAFLKKSRVIDSKVWMQIN